MNADHPHVRIDPRVAFGQPMIKGTPVDAIAGTLIAGDPLDVVADNYNLTRPEMLIACWHLAMHEPRWSAWRQWADRVHPLLARTPVDYDRVPDPPLDLLPERQPELTPRELQVLHGIAAGKTAAQIGRDLGTSVNTVHSQTRHLYRKLAVHTRLGAVNAARELGLLDEGGER